MFFFSSVLFLVFLMNYTYEYRITIDVSSVCSDAKNIIDEVNKNMREFGFDETMIVSQELSILKINSKRKLTNEEIATIRKECDNSTLPILNDNTKFKVLETKLISSLD